MQWFSIDSDRLLFILVTAQRPGHSTGTRAISTKDIIIIAIISQNGKDQPASESVYCEVFFIDVSCSQPNERHAASPAVAATSGTTGQF